MIKVIINADDFGINEHVTREIERMITAGLISSTTIMANGKCLEEVKSFAPLHQEISFGVHLCLSEFSSLTKSEALHHYGLTDETGMFNRKAIFNIKHFNSQLLKAIKEELSAQIEVVKSMNIPISHADSHHHVHTIYPLKELFAEVLKEHGIQKIRLGREFDSLRMKIHISLWWKRNQLNKFYSSSFNTASLFSPYDYFIHRHPVLKEDSVIELMCHPGHPEHKFKSEIKLIEKDTLGKIIDYELISYNDLH